MRLRSAVATAAALLPLLTAVPSALADPPEGCVGLPDVPEAFVCVTSWTPENAVPTVTSGSTTVWVPEFCVFTCVGPTPVTVPLASVTPNSGTVAVIRYKGQDYPISTSAPIPPDLPSVPSVQSTEPRVGFYGKGCSLLAVADSDQPDRWLVIVQGGPATNPNTSYESYGFTCAVKIDGWLVWEAGIPHPEARTIDGISNTNVIGICMVTWTRDHQGNYATTESCADATPLGNARIVV